MQWFELNDHAATALKHSVFAVEATMFELRALVREYKDRGLEYQADAGGIATIGSLAVNGEMQPVAVEVQFATYRNRWILFYTATSSFVDHDQVRKWVEEQGFNDAHLRTDPSNFAHALMYIDRLHEEEAATTVEEPPWVCLGCGQVVINESCQCFVFTGDP